MAIFGEPKAKALYELPTQRPPYPAGCKLTAEFIDIFVINFYARCRNILTEGRALEARQIGSRQIFSVSERNNNKRRNLHKNAILFMIKECFSPDFNQKDFVSLCKCPKPNIVKFAPGFPMRKQMGRRF